MAVAIPFIALALTAVSSVAASNNASDAARQNAAQDLQSAGEVRASSQRAAAVELKKSQYIQSRAQAIAASSGAGAQDPTVVNTIGDIAGEGEYRALTSIYEGDSRANAYINDANAGIARGKDQSTASLLQGASSIAGQGASLYEKYGVAAPDNSGYSSTQQGYSASAPGYVTDAGRSIFGRKFGYG